MQIKKNMIQGCSKVACDDMFNRSFYEVLQISGYINFLFSMGRRFTRAG